jgi:hypothetical protein
MRFGLISRLRGCLGFSVTEVTTILTAMTVLSGVAAPAVNDYVEQAKIVRAQHDVRTISVSLVRLLNDVGAERAGDRGWSAYALFVGAGATPKAGVRGTELWTLPVNAAAVGPLYGATRELCTDCAASSAPYSGPGARSAPKDTGRPTKGISMAKPLVGLLDDQLITNKAGYIQRTRVRQLGWRGAYLQDPITADPWGYRYGVNVGAMQSVSLDTVVLSAGADGIVDSPFESDGLPTSGDDIVSVVSTAGMGR